MRQASALASGFVSSLQLYNKGLRPFTACPGLRHTAQVKCLTRLTPALTVPLASLV